MTTTNFGAKTTAFEVVKALNINLDGKVVFITGATSGTLKLMKIISSKYLLSF